jgi:hypothetical protein
MGFLDKLFGGADEEYRRTTDQVRAASAARSEDEVAIERYRYLLRTAPPEAIEQVHEEAFAKLTTEQRHMVFNQLVADAPRGEAPTADDPRSLAVSATRSEMRQPGTLERSFSNVSPAGPTFGSMFASSLLGNIAGYFIISSMMSAFMPADAGADASDASGVGGNVDGADSTGDSGNDSADPGSDSSIEAASESDFDGGGFDGGGFDGGGFDGGFDF